MLIGPPIPHTIGRARTRMRTNPPNILLIMNDDMGYSDIGCYGGEVRTPNLDRPPSQNLRYISYVLSDGEILGGAIKE